MQIGPPATFAFAGEAASFTNGSGLAWESCIACGKAGNDEEIMAWHRFDHVISMVASMRLVQTRSKT